jgi:hypothetical protein
MFIRHAHVSAHANVVSSYLNVYRTSLQRHPFSDGFFLYLVARCWRKMYKRACHWSVMSFIEGISDIKEDTWNNVPSGIFQSGVVDKALARMLATVNHANFDKILSHLPLSIGTRTIDALLSRCKNIDGVLYDQETFLEFHSLFVATFVAYAEALTNLRRQCREKPVEVHDSSIRNILAHALMLFKIVTGPAFCRHLSALKVIGGLRMPDFSCRFAAETFAKSLGIKICMPTWRERQGEPTIGSEGEQSDAKEIYEQFDHLDEETARSWMKSLVDHFIAGRILQQYCSSPLGSLHEVRIDVVLISGPDLRVAMTLGTVSSTIKDLLSPEPDFDAEAAIKIISNIYQDVNHPHHKLVQSVFNSRELGTVHCEMALAALILFMDETSGDNEKLLEVLKVTAIVYYTHILLTDVSLMQLKGFIPDEDQPWAIAVSKLCCPVCWDFFDILRGSENDLQLEVRSKHSNLTMLYLPKCTPSNILKQMIERYSKYLRQELKVMSPLPPKNAGPRRHKYTHSVQSDSGLSNVSDSSTDSAGSVFNDLLG